MADIAGLPVLREGRSIGYFGSVDKRGKNNDYDWWLRKEGDEYIIVDIDGPGCIRNLMTAMNRSEALLRFYLDGATQPAFSVTAGQFGTDDPIFGPPLSQMVRYKCRSSMLPIAFAKSCKVTASEPMNQGTGGWGHLIHERFATADGIITSQASDDLTAVTALWRANGQPIANTRAKLRHIGTLALRPAEILPIFEYQGRGHIAHVWLRLTPPAGRGVPKSLPDVAHVIERNLTNALTSVSIQANWDDRPEDDIDCPIGAFFGNELRVADARTLTRGIRVDGTLYCNLPMPFWSSARISMANLGSELVQIDYEITYADQTTSDYDAQRCGHLRARYAPPKASVMGEDMIIGHLRGRGHVVSAQITAWGIAPGRGDEEEGDVRVHIDGSNTPKLHSDGSESWTNYGFGFLNGPRYNPALGYDASKDMPWSMTRSMTADAYYFDSELRFGIEHGNDADMVMSGALIWCGLDRPGVILSDQVDVGASDSSIRNYALASSMVMTPIWSCPVR